MLQGAFDAYAMGNYPYPIDYMGGDADHPLPAWPMRVACTHMTNKSKPTTANEQDLLAGLRDAAAVLYNVTGDVKCYDLGLSGPAAGSVPGRWG